MTLKVNSEDCCSGVRAEVPMGPVWVKIARVEDGHRIRFYVKTLECTIVLGKFLSLSLKSS